MRYLYIPFKTFSDDSAFRHTKKWFKKRYGKNGVIIERSHGWINKARKPLKVVKAGDTLLIVGHGDAGGPDNVFVNRRLLWKSWEKERTHNDMAQQLQDEGLAKTHRKIKLLTCEAAGPAVFDAATKALVDSSGADYFAQLLAKSLGKLGYSGISVGGYSGSLAPTTYDGGGTALSIFYEVINDADDEYEDGEMEVNAKGKSKWFNSTGTETTKPF